MTSEEDLRRMVERGYDACAADYARARDRFRNEWHLEELVRRLPADARILDLGRGSGRPIDALLLDRGFHVTGIDTSAQQVRLAERSLPGGELTPREERNTSWCWLESLPRTSCPGKRVFGRET